MPLHCASARGSRMVALSGCCGIDRNPNHASVDRPAERGTEIGYTYHES